MSGNKSVEVQVAQKSSRDSSSSSSAFLGILPRSDAGSNGYLRRYQRPLCSPGNEHNKDIISIALLRKPDDIQPHPIIVTASMDGTAKLWDLYSGAYLKTFVHCNKANDSYGVPMKLNAVDAHTFESKGSIVGSIVVTCSDDCTAFIWRATDGSIVWQLNRDRAIHTKPISSAILIDHEKAVVALGSHDRSCSIWELGNGNCLYRFSNTYHTDLLLSLTMHITGPRLEDIIFITASWDKSVLFWPLTNVPKEDQARIYRIVEPLPEKLTGHKKSVTTIWAHNVALRDRDIAMYGDGRSHVDSYSGERTYPVLVTGSLDKTAIVWDFNTREQIHLLAGHSSRVNAVRVVPGEDDFSPPSIITAGDDQLVMIWDMITGERIRTLNHHAKILSLSVFNSPFGLVIITGGSDKRATVWDLTRSNRIRHLTTGPVTGIGVYEPRPGDAVTKTNCSKVIIGDVLKVSTVFDLKSGSVMEKVEGHGDRLNFLVMHVPKDIAQPSYFVTCSNDATAKVWNASTHSLHSTLKQHEKVVFALAIYSPEKCHPDSIGNRKELSKTLVITGSLDTHIRFWDLDKTGDVTTSDYAILHAHGAFVRALAVYHPQIDSDTPLLISGSYDLTAKIWDLRTLRCLRTLIGHVDYVFLLSIYDPFAHLGVEEAEERGLTSPYVITGSYDRTAIVWDMRSGHPIRTLKGHKDSVTAMDLYVPRNPYDSPLLITGSIDTLVIIWDLFSGEALQRLVGHTDRVCFIHVHQPQDKNSHPLLLSGSDDKTTIIWEDALYSIPFMPLRDAVNRAFLSDLPLEDWPLITSLAQKYGSSLFMENTNLFFMAIENERPDFILKFRSCLSKCLRSVKNFEVDGKSLSLLEYALAKCDLISIRAILLSWSENLNLDIEDLLTQNVFHACYFFLTLKELVPLSQKYPMEYLLFISSIQLVRNHPSLLGDVKEKVLHQTLRYEIAGTHNGFAVFEDVWKHLIVIPTVSARVIDIWERIFSRRPPPEQPVTSLLLPLKQSPDLYNGFGVYADVSEQLQNMSIFDSAVGIYTVQYFWLRFSRELHVRSMVIYLAIMVAFTIVIYNYQYYYTPGESRSGDIAMNCYIVLVILAFFYYSIEESRQIRKLYWNSSPGAQFDWTVILAHFARDIWNTIDAAVILTGVPGLLIMLVLQRMTPTSRIYLALCSVLMWFKILYFLRPFSNSGPLVVMIIRIAYEIRFLLVVLLLVLCGFAQGFWLISNVDPSLPFGTVKLALINCFMYMLGNISDFMFEGSVAPSFGSFLVVIFLVIMMILMLNLLIALMGDTFSAVRAEGAALWRKEQASIIYEECFLLAHRIRTHRFIHVLKYTSDLQIDVQDDEPPLEKSVRDSASHVTSFTPFEEDKSGIKA
eukprot:gene7427-8212_t